jgi:long-chain acyl-CoA synthetase
MEFRLTQSIDRAAVIGGNRTATWMGERKRTWSEFRDRVARLAGGLCRLGVGPGDRVAILALNSDRYMEWFFAVPWAGAVFVPINTRLAAPEVAYWLNDSGSETLFIDDEFMPMLRELEGKLDTVQRIIYLGDHASPDGLPHFEGLIENESPVADSGRAGDDLAGLFYTGGTTGVSKGVMLSHTNLVVNALNITPVLKFDTNTNWLHGAPMFHAADGAGSFAVSLAAGAHSFIPRFDVVETLRAIETFNVTHTVLVPTMVNMIVHHPDIDRFDLSPLRSVLYGASPMPEAVIRRALDVMPNVRFTHGYGQTESGPFLSSLGPEYHDLSSPLSEKMTSIGHMGPISEVRVLDENDREVPRGVVGEICARGRNVMLGYWDKPELTAETLRNGWLHTGDGGYMDDDGFLYIVDRVKDMIISGGENVYSAEVENALYQHDAVAECAVIGIPSDTWGEQVHAIVRLAEGRETTEHELIEHCRRLIAGYKCARSIDFVTEPLPLSGAGKILKTELRKTYWQGRDKQVN